jgi:hypothetical protein
VIPLLFGSCAHFTCFPQRLIALAGGERAADKTRSDAEILCSAWLDMVSSRLHAGSAAPPSLRELVCSVFAVSLGAQTNDSAVSESVQLALSEAGLAVCPAQVEKAMQLHGCLKSHAGIIVVGPPGSGKSATMAALAAALKVRVCKLYTKSMSLERLLGGATPDDDSDEAVLPWLLRKVASDNTTKEQEWIVLDGPGKLDNLACRLFFMLSCSDLILHLLQWNRPGRICWDPCSMSADVCA